MQLGIVPTRTLPYPRSWRFNYVFFYSYRAFGLILGQMMNLNVYLNGCRCQKWDTFIILHGNNSCFSTICYKDYSFLIIFIHMKNKFLKYFLIPFLTRWRNVQWIIIQFNWFRNCYISSVKSCFLVYLEIIDIYHYISLRHTTWWFDIYILWNPYNNRFTYYPSLHTDTKKIKLRGEIKHFLSCDENSWDLLS